MSVSGSQSGQSASSFGSGLSGEGDLLANNGGDEAVEDTSTALDKVFSVAHTVAKDKSYKNWVFVGARLFLEWLQLFIVLVNPDYGWSINADNKWWQAFSFVQLYHFMSVRGYAFYLACLYLLVALLALVVGLGCWIANSLKNNNCTTLWPIQFVRGFGIVFFQVLDICLLTIFLMTLDCNYFGVDQAVKGFNQEFPDVYCWAMPHLIHVFVAALAIVMFLLLAGLWAMADVDLNPATRTLMAQARTKTEVLGFGVKCFMVLISVFLTDVKWMSVIQLLASFCLVYLYIRWLPHMDAVFNHIRIGAFVSVFWAALLLVIMSFHPGLGEHEDELRKQQQDVFTILLWAGFVPAGLLGAAISWKRTQFFAVEVVQKFRDAPLGTKARRIYAFQDAREVEIAARCCRVFVDEETLDEEAVALAERILRAGVALLPHQPFMAIWWSAFLAEVQGSYQAGYLELMNAKKSPSQGLMERYLVYVREQDHTQKSSAASGGAEHSESANVDLVSYVEFQRNYKLVLHLHYEALIARRTFWETLLHHTVTFDKMARALGRIETTVRAAERMYKQVLSRHGNSLKILALYVKFLQGLRNDPWSAARWTAEVEKMQHAEEEANERAVFGEGKTGGLGTHDDSKGIIIMGANSLIRMINEPAAAILGYPNRAEVVGKNISLIIPPPFARNHNTYVRNYIQTGQPKILNKLREFVALHKDRFLVPINIYVTKVSGVGEDSVFLSVFDRVPSAPDTATLWVMNGGLVLSCDEEFTDWLGYKHEDIHARPATDLVVDPQALQELWARIKEATTGGVRKLGVEVAGLPEPTKPDRSLVVPQGADRLQQLMAAGAQPLASGKGGWGLPGVQFRHMYLDLHVTVDVRLSVGSIGDTTLFVLKMQRKQDTTPLLLVTDAKGKVNHATSKLATRLGVTPSKLQAGGLMHAMDFLLPAPYARIHHQWYRDKPDAPPPWSCRSGLSMCLNAMSDAGPCVVPFAMEFKRKEVVGKDTQNVVLLTERTTSQALDERRLALRLSAKGMVLEAGPSPASLFGFDPQALVGSHLSYVVDILRPVVRGDSPSPSQLLQAEEAATKMLFHMAERSYDQPGMSWRCGITGIMDPVSLVALGPIGMSMMAKKMVPAALVVEGYMEPPTMEGARVLLPSELHLKVELWRADLLSGVVEVDTQGAITTLGIKDQPMFNPHLILGLPPAVLAGASLSALLPLHGKTLMEALFVEGGLAPPGKAGAGRGAGAGVRAGRGGLRNAGQLRRRGVSPLHTVKVQHGTDFTDMEVQLQAVVKQDMGTGCSLYVHLHVAQPRVGRPDFQAWLYSSPLPALPATKGPTSRRGSLLASGEGLAHSVRADEQEAVSKPKSEKERAQAEWREKEAALKAHEADKQLVQDPDADLPQAPRYSLDHPATPPTGGLASSAFKAFAAATAAATAARSAADVFNSQFYAPGMVTEAELADALEERASRPTKPEKGGTDTKAKPGGVQFRSQTSKSLEGGRTAKKKGGSVKGGSVRGGKAKARAGAAAGAAIGGGGEDDDAASDDSGSPRLKEGGRERITTWISTAQPSEHDDGEGSEQEEEEEAAEQQAAVDDDEEQEGAELDEAGSTMNDYKRGKRLKKLAKILLSPQSQSRNLRLKWVSVGTVLLLVVVDLAMFITFKQLVDVQKSQVVDLRSSAKAVNRVLTCCIGTSALQVLLAGKSDPEVFRLGEEGTAADVQYTMQAMETRLAEMETYHTGVYRGFQKLRQLPAAYGLRDTWDQPILPIRQFYQGPNATFSVEIDMGLWDAGNFFIKSVRNILQSVIPLYGVNTNRSVLFVNNTDVSFILYNGPRYIMTAYQATLDGLMQQAIDDSQKLNNIQLIILGIEGGLIGTISVVVIWVMASQVLAQRHAVFSLFMSVPIGVVRALATVAFNLEEGEEEEAENNEEGDAEGGHAASGPGAGSGGMDPGADLTGSLQKTPGAGAKAERAAAAANAAAAASKAQAASHQPVQSFWRRLFSKPAPAVPGHKRVVQPSLKPVLYLTWPFMLWAIFVAIINGVGYMELKDMSAPIAISNVVQFVAVRSNRVQMFSMRLVSEQYFDPTFSFTAPELPPGVYNPLKEKYKENLLTDYHDLKLEYDTMLYGHDSEAVRNQTTPHFLLAKKGIMFSEGAELMYNPTGCLCVFKEDCYPPEHPFYLYVMNGMDQMMKQYMISIESLLLLPDDEINIHSEHFKYIFEVGSSDLYGGLIKLTDVYTKEVVKAYDAALMLHIVAFAMCCGLGLLFILFIMQPSYQRVLHEARRVAELLAQLPLDLAVEPLLAHALRLNSSTSRPTDPQQAGYLGGAAGSLDKQALKGSGGRFGLPDEEGSKAKHGSAEYRGLKV